MPTSSRPLRVAIVGAGPAGYYTAEALLRQEGIPVRIDVFNRFPTPFGLVRDGVAPDHPAIKSVIRVYERISEDERVRYFGNVEFGRDLSREDLLELYDQVVYAVGAQADRAMGIPGEDLTGSWPATQFVGWYNGHPWYRDLSFDLSCERAVVVGNGNVAMDVARILLLPPEVLAATDIADHALEALRGSRIREVVLLGRRGPAQAAFTNPELRELGRIDGVDVIVDPADLELDPGSEAYAASDRGRTRNLETLRSYADTGSTDASRAVHLRFLVSPVELLGAEGRVRAVRIVRNRLVRAPDGSMRPRATEEEETIEAGLVLRSVGYRCTPLPDVPFDDHGDTIRNEEGRVLGDDGAPLPGEYVVGWAKRGPSGIIGTNKADASETVGHMLEDASRARERARDGREVARRLHARGADPVTWEDWRVLDAWERTAGEAQGRPRVKVCSVEEMMRIIRSARPSSPGSGSQA